MIAIPKAEKLKFEGIIIGNAKRFGLTPEEYLRKIWYHEEASRVGEYVALTLLDQILPLMPLINEKSKSGS